MVSRVRRPRHREFDGLARERLERTAFDLSVGPAAGRFTTFDFTATNAANTVTVTGQDALTLSRVILNGDDLPSGLEEGALYYLRRTALDTYTLHPSLGDAAGNTNVTALADDGSGSRTITIFED